MRYTLDVLKRFNILNCNSTSTPTNTRSNLKKDEESKLVNPTLYKQMMGCLKYLYNTRPNISYSVGLVSQFMDKPHHTHLIATKRILRYLKVTCNQGLLYINNKNYKTKEVVEFTNSDW